MPCQAQNGDVTRQCPNIGITYTKMRFRSYNVNVLSIRRPRFWARLFESLSPFPGWGETNLCFELWNRGFEKLGVQNMHLECLSSGNLGLSCTF